MIDWADNIPIGTSIDSVKKLQPNYIVIEWNKPNVNNTSKSFAITKIKGNTDPLNMSNTLKFVNEKYIGRFARK